MILKLIKEIYRHSFKSDMFISGGGSASGYVIERSLRFSAGSSQYLTRTFGTPTNNTVWTLSRWLKRGSLGAIQGLFTAGSAGIFFNASDQLIFVSNAGATLATSTRVFRDPSAHGHLYVTSNGTTIEAYWNNELALSYTGTITNLNSAIAHNIGRNAGGANQYFDGYDAEDIFVDGQALARSLFAETNVLTGQWVAKKYTGTYGTNGFYLDFKDGTSTTTLGQDKSGNNNNWTLTNFTRSAGVNDCWMKDVPSGNGEASAVQPSGNYAVLNDLHKYVAGNLKLSNGNLTVTKTTQSTGEWVLGSIAITSGSYYWEQVIASYTGGVYIGIANAAVSNTVNFPSQGYVFWQPNFGVYNFASTQLNATTYAINDVIGFALDATNDTLALYKNGTLIYTITSLRSNMGGGTTISSPLSPLYWNGGANNSCVSHWNFGQRSFAYTPPTGFKALCTANLTSTDVIESGSFTGNANAIGPFIWCNGTPETLTINGNAVTWGTHADRLSNGFKLRTSSSSYNSSGTNTWTATILSPESKSAFKHQNAKGN